MDEAHQSAAKDQALAHYSWMIQQLHQIGFLQQDGASFPLMGWLEGRAQK